MVTHKAVVLTGLISDTDWQQIKIAALEQNTTVRQLVAAVLTAWLRAPTGDAAASLANVREHSA